MCFSPEPLSSRPYSNRQNLASNIPCSISPSKLACNSADQESQLVGNVDTGSPAEAAGVKKGDKIIEVRQVFKDY